MIDFGLTVGAALLIVGFPLLLLATLAALARLESWMETPDAKAAEVVRLLDQVAEAEEVERAVALTLADVADRPRVRAQARRGLLRMRRDQAEARQAAQSRQVSG